MLKKAKELQQQKICYHITNKNTHSYIYIYNDKEQDHQHCTDTKIATIGDISENIYHVVIFY